MRRRGFTLIEIMVVVSIMALLAALLAGAYNRYRANLNMVQSAQRLMAEITNAQQQARTSGLTQMRGGVELAAAPLTQATVLNKSGTLQLRVYEATPPSTLRGLRKIYLLDDSTVTMKVTATNVADVPVVAGDSGIVMEVGIDQGGSGTFQRLFTLPFNTDGTVALPLDTESARIVLDNSIYQRQIEVSRLGKVKETRL